MPTGLVQIWVYDETREILRKLSKVESVTMADLVRSRFEDAKATEKGYKREKEMDRALEKGDFKIRQRRVPKPKDEFFLPDTRKEWDKLYADRWEEFGEWYLATRGREWPGDDNYYNNLSRIVLDKLPGR